ncbi:MAG: restriction endonuclease subunit S [Rhodospirillales bacterium]|nr:restriction endonuclease subunit S [Rhodospirillales bacterium]
MSEPPAPALRFKDAQGRAFPDWQMKRLEEVAHKTASSIRARSLETSSGDYPVYGANGIAGFVDYFSSDEPHIGVVKDGAGVGRLYYCPSQSSVLGTLESVTASGGNSTKFIYYWMSQINFAAYSTGSTIPHVYFKDYGKKKGRFPDSAEQSKIAAFLSAVDRRIALLERRRALLTRYKRGLMQKLFSRDLRFKDAQGRNFPDWQVKRLGEVGRYRSGNFVSASEISDTPQEGLFPCFGANGLRGYTSSKTQSGTFALIGRQGALCGNVQLVSGDFHATEHAIVVFPNIQANTIWLYYELD